MKKKAGLSQKQSVKPRQKLITRIRLASFLQLGEKKFSEYIIEVENDPLFKKLFSPENAETRVISSKRFPKTIFSLGSLSFSEQLSGDSASFDIEKMLGEKSGTVALIKKIGIEKFEKYFLCGDEPAPVEEIIAHCAISKGDAAKITELLNDLALRTEFYHTSTLNNSLSLSYCRIAEIDYNGKDGFLINFYSPKYISGLYTVNKAKLASLKKQNAFSAEEVSRINGFMEKIDLINARKSTIYQIISRLIQVQKNYLYSGEDKFLVPYTQRKLSQDIGFDNSVVCRAIFGRSLVTPRGVEKPLSFFFPSNKDVRKIIIEKIFNSVKAGTSDREIVGMFKGKFNICLSRRTVNAYRNELNRGRRKK
jgi:DNA-directed RNA polymerase specialized sigma54-like protein